MVYKKYISKNGKVYGPYFYQSKRINGKVVSEYHGANGEVNNEKSKKIFPVLLILTILALGAFGFFMFQDKGITGNLIFGVDGNLIDGKLEGGKLNLVLTEGEMIPKDSKIIFENEGSTQEYNLAEFLQEETELGEFYIKDSGFSGSGEGYGVIGEIEVFPIVSFELILLGESESEEELSEETPNEEISEETENETGETPNNEGEEVTPPAEENNNEESLQEETPIETEGNTEEEAPTEETETEVEEETSTNEELKTNEETSSESEESSSEESSLNAPITGNAISGIFGGFSSFITGLVTGENSGNNEKIISGEVSKEREFIVNAKNAKIVSGSVNSEGETLPEETITLEKDGETIIVKTDYSKIEKGFGEKYLGQETKTLSLDLSELNTPLKNGNLNVKLVYENEEIASFSQVVTEENIEEEIPVEEIIEAFNETNLTETPELNFTLELTEIEKEMIKSYLNESSVTTEVRTYRNRYLARFILGNYNAEYSYSQDLNEEKFKYFLERDRYLWLKDIVESLNGKTPSTSVINDLSGNFEI